MSPRTILFIIVLAGAAVGSWYLARPSSPAQQDSVFVEPVYRGYYLKEARILGTGKDGKLLYEIEAEHAEQQEDQSIEFTDVRVRYSPESDVPWTVNADEASLSENNPKIMLRGDVVAFSRSETSGQETEIRTEHLELDPDAYVAETDARVQIRIGQRSLTATGMLASLHDQKVELKSNVRGRIAP